MKPINIAIVTAASALGVGVIGLSIWLSSLPNLHDKTGMITAEATPSANDNKTFAAKEQARLKSQLETAAAAAPAPATPPTKSYENMTKDEKVADLLQRIAEHDNSYARRNLYEQVVALVPDNKDYKAKYSHYKKLSDTADAKTSAKAKAEKHWVSIGASQQEVLASSWGKPSSVNRTTTAHGVHEQWVYGGNNFLYFDNGVLTAIQN